MLILGYVFAIRSERALCREVQLNLAYRWFCGLGIEDNAPTSWLTTRPIATPKAVISSGVGGTHTTIWGCLSAH